MPKISQKLYNMLVATVQDATLEKRTEAAERFNKFSEEQRQSYLDGMAIATYHMAYEVLKDVQNELAIGKIIPAKDNAGIV